MLEVNCDTCDRMTNVMDSLDKVGMGRAIWGKLLVLCTWWRAPRLSHPTVTDPEVMA